MKKLFLFFIPFLLGCNSSINNEKKEEIIEHDYSEVNEYEISFNDMFKISNETHYVYCYSLTCLNCKSIKNKIIDKALKIKNIYFSKSDLNIQDLDTSYTIGMNDVNNVFIRGVPSLIKIEDNKVSKNIVGKSKVCDEIDTL